MKPDKYTKFRTLFRAAKRSSIKKNLEFNLTLHQLYRKWLRQRELCALTGIQICFGKNGYEQKHGFNTASIDRIDSNKGYTIRNVQWVHKDVNFLKSNFNQKKFISICRLVALNYAFLKAIKEHNKKVA